MHPRLPVEAHGREQHALPVGDIRLGPPLAVQGEHYQTGEKRLQQRVRVKKL